MQYSPELNEKDYLIYELAMLQAEPLLNKQELYEMSVEELRELIRQKTTNPTE